MCLCSIWDFWGCNTGTVARGYRYSLEVLLQCGIDVADYIYKPPLSDVELVSDVEDSSTSGWGGGGGGGLTRGHWWGAPKTLEGGSAHPTCVRGVGSKLHLPLYADVRLYIPITHHNDVGSHVEGPRG